MEIISLSCPSCGAHVSTQQQNCEYCQSPIILTSFKGVSDMPLPQINKYANSYKKSLTENPDNRDLNLSVGICYLRLKMYEKAAAAFEKATAENFDNPEPFFLAAVSLLQGKKPFVTPRPAINQIEEYLNAAVMIEPQPVFYYFMSYIKQDYYNRKFFKTSPTAEELFTTAIQYGLTEYDINSFHAMLGVPRP
ncbi:zinc ribbon domain-containing protein [uncultured Bacteroides sp.]|uniref:zinc ribbon domain-containing protein n=1 Tax=uncultured Bacteroides sp. TaxID=162156 RepID=UPI0025CE5CAD|nr:zinc ribbon domain-containing protein [uncultured Bacteroides sp.]